MTRPLRGPAQPDRRRPLDRRLRHDRLAGEERARVERQGRHARQLVRGLHRGDGAGQPASGAEGGGADEPDGRRLDGRRLVPLRRLPPDQLRLLRRPDVGARRRAATSRAQGYDDYENFRRAGSAGDFAKAAGLDQLPCWRKIAEHPAYDAFWQEQALDTDDGGAAADGADDVDPGAVGPGGHVGRDPDLPRRSSRRTRANDDELPGDGPVAAQRRQLRRARRSGRCKWDGDTALQFRRDVLKPFFDQYLKDGAPKADTPPVLHLQHRREPLGSLRALAAGLRDRLRRADRSRSTSPADFGLSFTAPAAGGAARPPTTSTSPIRPSRCPTCRGRCASPTARPGAPGW